MPHPNRRLVVAGLLFAGALAGSAVIGYGAGRTSSLFSRPRKKPLRIAAE